MFIDEVEVLRPCRARRQGAAWRSIREAYAAQAAPQRRRRRPGRRRHPGQADHDLNNLINQFYVPRLIAEPGGVPGMGKGMDGPAGKDLIIRVPCGTLV
jgi:GTPase involved in cell partitioning and DNA repair